MIPITMNEPKTRKSNRKADFTGFRPSAALQRGIDEVLSLENESRWDPVTKTSLYEVAMAERFLMRKAGLAFGDTAGMNTILAIIRGLASGPRSSEPVRRGPPFVPTSATSVSVRLGLVRS